MKSKQELIEEWESAVEAAEFYGKGKEERLISYMKDFVSDLNQLEETEVLSQEWIDKRAEYYEYFGYVGVPIDDLKDLLVPKQELAVVPQEVADWYENHKDNLEKQLQGIAFNLDKYGEMPEVNDLDKWINKTESPLQTLASLKFGYEVEKDQEYILSINITDKASNTAYETFLNKRGIFHSMENESFNSEEFNWTEEEIKDLESGEILFEHFATKVEELEE